MLHAFTTAASSLNKTGSSRARMLLVMAGLTLMLSACAALPSNPLARAEIESLNDPFEPANRKIHEFNSAIRKVVLLPVVETYNSASLMPLRTGLGNVLGNLREPLVFVNDLAQGRDCAAGATLQRFMINSTVGIAGLMDVARTHVGIEAHDNDFGLTLGVWGVPEGPYVVLPLLGPSHLRGVVGLGVEYFFDPMDLMFAGAGVMGTGRIRMALDVFDRQADSQQDLDKLERTSLDAYASLRSAFRQNEARQMKDSHCPEVLRTDRE